MSVKCFEKQPGRLTVDVVQRGTTVRIVKGAQGSCLIVALVEVERV